jgi:hypothetical protein
MKKQYIKPSMTVVRLQQQHIICQSPGGYGDQNINMSSGTDNQISDESFVWTKESTSLWDDEW